jgi:hypothetical protein
MAIWRHDSVASGVAGIITNNVFGPWWRQTGGINEGPATRVRRSGAVPVIRVSEPRVS